MIGRPRIPIRASFVSLAGDRRVIPLFSAAIGVLLGLGRNRPLHRTPWLLAGAALVGPVTLVATNLTGYEMGPAGDLGVAITAALVFLLVILRLVDVMASQRRAHDALERQGEELRDVVEALRKAGQERVRLF